MPMKPCFPQQPVKLFPSREQNNLNLKYFVLNEVKLFLRPHVFVDVTSATSFYRHTQTKD